MTPSQVLSIAFLGGLAALLGTLLVIVAAVAVFAAVTRVVDAHTAYRERRQILADHRRALDALPTTTHPKEDRR